MSTPPSANAHPACGRHVTNTESELLLSGPATTALRCISSSSNVVAIHPDSKKPDRHSVIVQLYSCSTQHAQHVDYGTRRTGSSTAGQCRNTTMQSSESPTVPAPPVRGRGLTWTDDKNTALAMIAKSLCADLSSGNEMKDSQFHRLVRFKFLKHSLCPPKASLCEKDDGPLDLRRWHERSECAVGLQWETSVVHE
eukprot:IDg3907t1